MKLRMLVENDMRQRAMQYEVISILPECEFHVEVFRRGKMVYDGRFSWGELPEVRFEIHPPTPIKSDPFADVSDTYGGGYTYTDVRAKLRGSHEFIGRYVSEAENRLYNVFGFTMMDDNIRAVMVSEFLDMNFVRDVAEVVIERIFDET